MLQGTTTNITCRLHHSSVGRTQLVAVPVQAAQAWSEFEEKPLCVTFHFFFVFPSHEDTSKKWIFLQECCRPWPAVPPDWLLSACQLWCLLECFIHVVLLWNTSAEKKPYIARFWLANFSDLLLPVWQSQSKGQEKPWVAAHGASPHYMLCGLAPISWDNPFFAALKHSFRNSWFHKVCIMKNKRKWTIENIMNAAALW